jgi:hypothetical protein
MPVLPKTKASFIQLVQDRLHRSATVSFAFNTNGDLSRISAVLFLMGAETDGKPFLILNKRSRRVRQPGDLCCPGGGVSPSIDSLLARWLNLPVTPLARWLHHKWWRNNRKRDLPKLALILATALREGFEEMRLNPFGIRFLGPLPCQHLVLFDRAIYPLVAWVPRQRHFLPNWEVETIVRIPIETFFNAGNYARYRISFAFGSTETPAIPDRELPCFIHRHEGHSERLWGATYRITQQFLHTVFDYAPPPISSMPVIRRRLDRNYLDGLTASNPEAFPTPHH